MVSPGAGSCSSIVRLLRIECLREDSRARAYTVNELGFFLREPACHLVADIEPARRACAVFRTREAADSHSVSPTAAVSRSRRGTRPVTSVRPGKTDS